MITSLWWLFFQSINSPSRKDYTLVFVRVYQVGIHPLIITELCFCGCSKCKQQSPRSWLSMLSVHSLWEMAYFQIFQTGSKCYHMSHRITLASLCYVTSRMWLTSTTCNAAERCCPPDKFQNGTVFRNQDLGISGH